MTTLFEALVCGDPWGWTFVVCVAVGVGIVCGAHFTAQDARGFQP